MRCNMSLVVLVLAIVTPALGRLLPCRRLQAYDNADFDSFFCSMLPLCTTAQKFAKHANDMHKSIFAARCVNAYWKTEYPPPTCNAPKLNGKPALGCSGQGNGNAFKHAYWNALMSFYQGRATAVIYASQHEDNLCTYSWTDVETRMDCNNNGVGRDIGLSWSTYYTSKNYNFDSEKKYKYIARAVLDAVRQGKLHRMVRYSGGAGVMSSYSLVPTSSECIQNSP